MSAYRKCTADAGFGTFVAVWLIAVHVVIAALLAGGATNAAAAGAVSAKITDGTLAISGTPASDQIALRLRAGSTQTLQIDVGDDGTPDFNLKRDRFAKIVVEAGDGNDVVRIDEANGIFTDTEQTTLDGGAGDDALTGGTGPELFVGRDGKDVVDPKKGSDVALLGAGDDTLTWNPGDGNDVVEGQDGADKLVFTGSGASETIDVSANGPRVRLLRDIGAVAMDLGGVEDIELEVLGGSDTITVGDLSGTDLVNVSPDLEGVAGSGTGDGRGDRTVLTGTSADESVVIQGAAGAAAVAGLTPFVAIRHTESDDQLIVRTGAGDDTVDASSLAAGALYLTADTGTGADTISGSAGADILVAGPLTGGDDNVDLVDGNQGDDLVLLGTGSDTFVWNADDGNDTVDGQAGFDELQLNGSNAAETVTVAANSGRLRITRDVGGVVLDANGFDLLNLHPLGGADTIDLNDVTGTDAKQFNVDLVTALGVSDGQFDRVVFDGTPGDDTFAVAASASHVEARTFVNVLSITHADNDDNLVINTLDGNDTVDRSAFDPSVMPLTVL